MDNKQLLNQLKQFFPDDEYSSVNIDQYLKSGEIETDEETLANTLKVALLDESIIEVELKSMKKVFFCRILDSPCEKSTDEEQNIEYEIGSYLDEHDHVIITPLEPSMGNYFISSDNLPMNQILLRIISSGNSMELGCMYQERTLVGDLPALKLTFPQVAKKTSGSREYRAKVPENMKFQVVVERLKRSTIVTKPINISLNGMALIDPMGRRTNLMADEKVVCELQLPNQNSVVVESSVIHATRLRNSSGVQYVFGIKFNFDKPETKMAIEKVVAIVQRKHLQELVDIEERFGVDYPR
jgi:hypothetical protein